MTIPLPGPVTLKSVEITIDPTPQGKISKVKPKKPSTPVRNPAFREHEGLKALQRELHNKSSK